MVTVVTTVALAGVRRRVTGRLLHGRTFVGQLVAFCLADLHFTTAN